MDGNSQAFAGISGGYSSYFLLKKWDYSSFSKIYIKNLGTYNYKVTVGATIHTTDGTYDVPHLQQDILSAHYWGAAINPPISIKIEFLA